MNNESEQPIDEEQQVLFDDDEEAFIDIRNAVEVPVDDENVPMDDDDDDDEKDTNHTNNANTNNDNENDNQQNDDDETDLIPEASIHLLTSHKPNSVYAAAGHYDTQTNTLSLITGGGDDKAFLHHFIRTSSSITTTPLSYAHTDSVSCTAINVKYVTEDRRKTPKYVAVGSYDGTIALYDPESGSLIGTLDGPTDVEFVSFHPKGGSVLLAGSISDATVWMYHLPTSKCLQVFVGHECRGDSSAGGVTAGTFTPDGKFAITIGMDGTLRIWAPRTGLCRHVFTLIEEEEEGGGAGLTCLDVNGGRDGQLAIAGGDDGVARVVHLQGKKVVATLRHVDSNTNTHNAMDVDAEEEEILLPSVEAVQFAPHSVNRNWVATGGSDGILKIWDLTHGDGGQCRHTCRVASTVGAVTRLVWHPTLPLVFASYADGAVRVWDARDGTLVKCCRFRRAVGEEDTVNDLVVEFVPKENGVESAIVVTAGDDGMVRVFEMDVEKAVELAAQAKLLG